MKLNLFVFGSAKLIALFSVAALSHEICVCVCMLKVAHVGP